MSITFSTARKLDASHAYRDMLSDINRGMDYAVAHENAVLSWRLSEADADKLQAWYDREQLEDEADANYWANKR